MARPLILVTMGTNDYPFTRLAKLLQEQPLYQSRECEWFVQTGSCVVEQAPALGEVCKLIPRDKMESLVRRSALVISHCGIGSLNLMLQYRKQVIFVPRVEKYGEFSDDHQLQIAREIKNPLMDVVFPETPFPTIELDKLLGAVITDQPVDITNYHLAKVVNYKLTA